MHPENQQLRILISSAADSIRAAADCCTTYDEKAESPHGLAAALKDAEDCIVKARRIAAPKSVDAESPPKKEADPKKPVTKEAAQP